METGRYIIETFEKTPDKLDVIIAHDHPESVHLLKELCSSVKGLNTPEIARSKAMLSAKLKRNIPDLIFLNLSPEMGGIQMIETIRKINPEQNIIITYTPDYHESDLLVTALEMGAYECLEMPEVLHGLKYKELRLHLLTVTGLLRTRKRFSSRPESQAKNRKKPRHKTHYKNKFFMPPKRKPSAEKKKIQGPNPHKGKIEIIAIASSTGGPEILSRIFSILPGSLKVPIVLVQHIPKEMTEYFAKSLDEKSELEISQARDGDEILPSKVYVAPGGHHMTLSKPDTNGKRLIRVNDTPPVNNVRPSADVLFESIAKSYNGHILAVVLTGMGEDGKKGVAKMKKSGCTCITQNAETCVIYGMPRAVAEAGLSDEQLDPLSITQKIVMVAQ